MNDATRTLGIDIGGTKIALGEHTDAGDWRALERFPTVPRDGEQNLANIRDALVRHGSGVTGIGISLATTTDEYGIVRDPRGWFGWTGLDLLSALRTDIPVTIEPDAACGAVAEARLGAGAGAERVLYITLGTGISHCVVTAGVPSTGSHGAGILSGSTSPFRSSWPARASWASVEDIASGPGLAAAFIGSSSAVDAHPVAEAYRRGDGWARRVVEHAAWQLGALVAALVTANDPDRVVVGGGLAAGFPEYVSVAEDVTAVLLSDWHATLTPYQASRFGAESCWIGAALLSAARSVPERVSV